MHNVTVVADQIAQLEAAIAAQDGLRAVLGDAAIDTAISAMRAQLEMLRADESGRPQPAWVPAPEEALAQLQARVPAALADKARVTGTSRRADGERRNVTVLFADLSGFTALSERFDPEVIRAFQHDLFDEMASVVYEYEGFVEKFVGDAIVSVFGAPLTHEDDPERALRAALAIRERMDGVNQRWVEQLGESLTIHIGVNSGTVVAGQIGAEHGGGYAVTGDTINTASRLQDAAQPGQILVSLNTHRLAHEAFAFRRLKPLRVQGKREPLTVFELQRAKLYPGKSRGVRGLSSPMVGRGLELEQLQRVTDGLAAGSGQVVIVTGEAGIGKSRLMAEWRASLGKEVRWLEGRSFAGASSVPYGPFADLSRRYAGITDDDSEPRARSRLSETLERVLPGDREATAIVAGMLGMGPEADEADYLATLSSQALKQRLFTLIEGLFARLAQERPTVLVMEDLHWADGSSLELIEHLLPLVKELPLAIVGVFRRGQDELPLWPLVAAEYGDRLVRVELAPLPEPSTVTLVEELLSTSELLPPAARDLIVGKAEGNPFFVEEVIRSLIERGALVRSADHRGRWIATPLIDTMKVPDTLQGVLMARLDGLPAETRRIAQLAAVIGRTFQYRVLLKIAEDAAGLEADLGQLERDELILELRREPELEYIFKHALTQEVAYESLLRPLRRDLHAQVGTALEELVADRVGEFQAILGGHFLRGEEWERAYTYLTQAGRAATRLHAHPEARLHFDNALEAVSHQPSTDEMARVASTRFSSGSRSRGGRTIRSATWSCSGKPRVRPKRCQGRREARGPNAFGLRGSTTGWAACTTTAASRVRRSATFSRSWQLPRSCTTRTSWRSPPRSWGVRSSCRDISVERRRFWPAPLRLSRDPKTGRSGRTPMHFLVSRSPRGATIREACRNANGRFGGQRRRTTPRQLPAASRPSASWAWLPGTDRHCARPAARRPRPRRGQATSCSSTPAWPGRPGGSACRAVTRTLLL